MPPLVVRRSQCHSLAGEGGGVSYCCRTKHQGRFTVSHDIRALLTPVCHGFGTPDFTVRCCGELIVPQRKVAPKHGVKREIEMVARKNEYPRAMLQ